MPIGCDSSPLGSKILSYLSHTLARLIICNHFIIFIRFALSLAHTKSPSRLHTPFRHLISKILILRRASPHFRSLTFPPFFYSYSKNLPNFYRFETYTALFTQGRIYTTFFLSSRKKQFCAERSRPKAKSEDPKFLRRTIVRQNYLVTGYSIVIA